jgi:hypothetical protein
VGIVERKNTEWLAQTKSAEYEKPRNSSCIACDRTVGFVSSSLFLLSKETHQIVQVSKQV